MRYTLEKLPSVQERPRSVANRGQHARKLTVGFVSIDPPGAPGGGEIQRQCTAQALQEMQVEVIRVDHRQAIPRHLDLLHCFGTHRSYLPLVLQARQMHVRTLLSPIYWLDIRSRWLTESALGRRLIGLMGALIKMHVPGVPSWQRQLYSRVDRLLPNSKVEADMLSRLFKRPTSQLQVIPNAADIRFAHANADTFAAAYGVQDFVLYAGRVEPRKNQLRFLQAMQGLDLPIVILGNAVPGHECYLRQCQAIAGPNVRFISNIDHDDPLLPSAYAAARCLVLTSWFETPGLVALEAGMSGLPLVLTPRGSAVEYFGDRACYAAPDNLAQIRQGVIQAYQNGRSTRLASWVQSQFTWQKAAIQTRQAYLNVLDAVDEQLYRPVTTQEPLE